MFCSLFEVNKWRGIFALDLRLNMYFYLYRVCIFVAELHFQILTLLMFFATINIKKNFDIQFSMKRHETV